MSKNIPSEMLGVVDLFAKDPVELADNDEDVKKIVSYLRGLRENFKQAEAAGKKITKKTVREGVEGTPERQSLSDLLNSTVG